MSYPCISLITFINSQFVAQEDVYNKIGSTARAANYRENFELVPTKNRDVFDLKTHITDRNRTIVCDLIKYQGEDWLFTYKNIEILLYGCVVVFACQLKYPQTDESFTHFLLTSIYNGETMYPQG